MDHFHYHDKQLFAEQVSVAHIAKRWGTPTYVYSRATLERHYQVFSQALQNHAHLICYAVKANSNLAVLNVLARLGSGFAIVSGGELSRVLAAGGEANKVVFSGVGKTATEMEQALNAGIYCFNVESFAELEQLQNVATRLKKIAPIAIRVNPDIPVKTHHYITTGSKDNKFGIDYQEALKAYSYAANSDHLRIVGVACHIGSQITELEPFVASAQRLLALVEELKKRGIAIEHIDLGGGLGAPYYQEKQHPPEPKAYAAALAKVLEKSPAKMLVEPGRVIAANIGILVTRVTYLKMTTHKNFAIVDAGMNDLIRPPLYEAWHDIVPVNTESDEPQRDYDVVGPVCESSDFLGKNRKLAIKSGDLLAVRSAGAYGFIMGSNYNSRPRAAEIMVDGDQAFLIRRRETVEDLYASELILPQ